ncbi:MAG: hypothetical protein JO327_03500 [Nitrososphaeraceae archaeon]|nr:hypothetical protein [Nitrososphaeraceae archaeon]MBV9667176.1 hypothetical protein [Nitrososphaeraceae archaeon]
MKVNDHNHNNALNEISDSQGVIEVTGEYTGGMTARGASHEHRDMRDYFNYFFLNNIDAAIPLPS